MVGGIYYRDDVQYPSWEGQSLSTPGVEVMGQPRRLMARRGANSHQLYTPRALEEDDWQFEVDFPLGIVL